MSTIALRLRVAIVAIKFATHDREGMCRAKLFVDDPKASTKSFMQNFLDFRRARKVSRREVLLTGRIKNLNKFIYIIFIVVVFGTVSVDDIMKHQGRWLQ